MTCRLANVAGAALGVGNRGGLSAVRRNESGAQILSHDAVRELMRDPVDLAGIEVLQLYIQGKGGNATRYVCEYKFDRLGYKASARGSHPPHSTGLRPLTRAGDATPRGRTYPPSPSARRELLCPPRSY